MMAVRVLLPLLLVLATSCGSTVEKEQPATKAEESAGRLLQEGRHEEALAAFSKIAYDGVGSHRALVGMAHCYAQLGDQARFEVFALEAGAQAPFAPSAHYRMGVMYVQGAERLRRSSGAYRYAQLGVEYLRRVFVTKHDYHPDLVPTLGLGLHLSGDDRGATVMLEEVVQSRPDRVDALHTLLLCYRNLRDRKRVKELLAPYEAENKMPQVWQSLWTWSNGAS